MAIGWTSGRETDLNRSEWGVAKTTSTVRAPAGRQRVHYLGLRQPRRSSAQDMPAGQQRDAQAIEQQLLAERDRLQLGLQVRKTPNHEGLVDQAGDNT